MGWRTDNRSDVRREADMYEPLMLHFRALGMVVLREVSTYQGRADVLAVRVDWSACARRRELGLLQAVEAPQRLRVWAALPARLQEKELDELASALAILPSTLRGHLGGLLDQRVVERDGRAFVRRARPSRIVKEVVCCEAKLTDWQSGVRQAYGHRFYAHRSFVALARIPRTLDVSVLERRRLGLISVKEGEVRRERHAPVSRPSDGLAFLHLQERAWSAIVREHKNLRAASGATA